ncbi:hypothetical protein BH11BAC5_BH11BAC5_11220 [soil metagenome]
MADSLIYLFLDDQWLLSSSNFFCWLQGQQEIRKVIPTEMPLLVSLRKHNRQTKLQPADSPIWW